MKRAAVAALIVLALAAVRPARTRAAGPLHYQLVENWVHFPPGVSKWGMVTGVDVDSHDNVFVFHRNDRMPIMEFDRHGNFVGAWGQGLFKTTHFLRVDRQGSI